MNRWLISAICVLSCSLTFADKTQKQDSEITQVILLGTGNPNPIPERAGPSTAIIVNNTPYLFDAGEGVMRQAEAARVKHKLEGLGRTKFAHLFLTHLHWDHTVGVPEVMMTPWTQGRKEPLKVFGPLGTKNMMNNFSQAFKDDIHIRISGLEPANDKGWQIETTEFDGNYLYEDENVKVEAFRVCHGNFEQSVGYKVITPDKVIVLSGDTAYCPIIAEKAKGADILIHEGYPSKSHAKLPKSWADYHTAYHTSAVDIARIANAAKPKLVVLSHQLTWMDDPLSMIVDEVAETYKGNVINGNDLDKF